VVGRGGSRTRQAITADRQASLLIGRDPTSHGQAAPDPTNRRAPRGDAGAETRSDEELEAETKLRAGAQAILGAGAERDAGRARHFRMIATRAPQERMQLRRMADASLALAERRPDDAKQVVERPAGGRRAGSCSCCG
jgi:hypothetical protein